MTRFTQYELQDFIAAELARIYSSEFREPFFVATGKFVEFDIASQSRKLRLEIKCDALAAKTGNLAVEYWNLELNTPSGILGTTANFWLHLVCEKYGFTAYEFDTSVLRRLVIEEGQIRTHGNALFKIIPLTTLTKYARRVFAFDSKFFDDFQFQQNL